MLKRVSGTLGVWPEPFLTKRSHKDDAESTAPGSRQAAGVSRQRSFSTLKKLTHADNGNWLKRTVLSISGFIDVRHFVDMLTAAAGSNIAKREICRRENPS